MNGKGKPLVLFDDTCGLCNFIVRQLLRIDKAGVLRFATLQGTIGLALVGGDVSSIVYIQRFEIEDERRPHGGRDGALRADADQKPAESGLATTQDGSDSKSESSPLRSANSPAFPPSHLQTFSKTDAVLAILTHLPAPWRWLRVFRVVPRPLRDFMYVLVARTRYAIFGEYKPRPLEKKEWRDRFIDGSRQ